MEEAANFKRMLEDPERERSEEHTEAIKESLRDAESGKAGIEIVAYPAEPRLHEQGRIKLELSGTGKANLSFFRRSKPSLSFLSLRNGSLTILKDGKLLWQAP